MMFASGLAMGEWVQDGIEENGSIFYDPATVARMPGGRASMWSKFIQPPENIKKYLSRNNGYIDYGYSIAKYVYDCEMKQAALSNVTDYTNGGRALYNNSYLSNLDFYDIVPGSYGDFLLKVACTTIQKNKGTHK